MMFLLPLITVLITNFCVFTAESGCKNGSEINKGSGTPVFRFDILGWLGKHSYSVYLFQYLVIYRLDYSCIRNTCGLNDLIAKELTVLGVCIILSLGFNLIGYYLNIKKISGVFLHRPVSQTDVI
jgi:peptidoglycan/LPS O-acetylase OafA/YrhL